MKAFWLTSGLLLGVLGYSAYSTYEPREVADQRFGRMCVESGFDGTQCQFLYMMKAAGQFKGVGDGDSYGAGFVNGVGAAIKAMPKQPKSFEIK